MPLTSQRFALPAVLVVFLSCQVAAQPTPQPVARIINGQPTDAFEAVGIVGSNQSGGFCTGTLISSTHVLTAGHCAQFIDGDSEATFEVGGQVYNSVEISIHPAFDPFTFENDVAVIELSQPVTDVEPASIFRGPPLVGDELTIVGFGAGGNPEGGAAGSFGEKMVGVTFIDDVDELFVYWTFDDPSEANTAPGDSGGPGFIEVAGEMFIAAVTSGGSNSDAALGDMAFNARVDTYQAWIDGATGVGGPTSPGEPPTDQPPTDGLPSDESPSVPPELDESDCPGDQVDQAFREIFAAILNFLTSDPFIQLLQDLADELSDDDSVDVAPEPETDTDVG